MTVLPSYILGMLQWCNAACSTSIISGLSCCGVARINAVVCLLLLFCTYMDPIGLTYGQATESHLVKLLNDIAALTAAGELHQAIVSSREVLCQTFAADHDWHLQASVLYISSCALHCSALHQQRL